MDVLRELPKAQLTLAECFLRSLAFGDLVFEVGIGRRQLRRALRHKLLNTSLATHAVEKVDHDQAGTRQPSGEGAPGLIYGHEDEKLWRRGTQDRPLVSCRSKGSNIAQAGLHLCICLYPGGRPRACAGGVHIHYELVWYGRCIIQSDIDAAGREHHQSVLHQRLYPEEPHAKALEVLAALLQRCLGQTVAIDRQEDQEVRRGVIPSTKGALQGGYCRPGIAGLVHDLQPGGIGGHVEPHKGLVPGSRLQVRYRKILGALESRHRLPLGCRFGDAEVGMTRIPRLLFMPLPLYGQHARHPSQRLNTRIARQCPLHERDKLIALNYVRSSIKRLDVEEDVEVMTDIDLNTPCPLICQLVKGNLPLPLSLDVHHDKRCAGQHDPYAQRQRHGEVAAPEWHAYRALVLRG